MLRLRAGTATLLIGPRSSAGVHGSRYCLDSETDIRQRLTQSLHDPASREAIRRFWGHWQSDLRLAGVKDQSIVDRIAHMGVRGPLIVFLVTDTSVNRRDTSASRTKQVAEAQQNQVQFKPWTGPVKPPAPIAVSSVTPAASKTPTPVDRTIITPPKKMVGDWTIAEKLTAIVMRTPKSGKLPHAVQQQLEGMLSDPKFVAWLIGSLLVWFVAQFFVVGEIFDMLLAGAALILSGAGIFFALQSLVGAAHLIGEFVEATRNAMDEKDLDAAADILANIIVMIGITVLIAALTHATTRATSEGAKVSTVKKPPEERPPPPTNKIQKRPDDGPLKANMFDMHVLKYPKGKRPDPKTYIPKSVYEARLAKFDKGATKIMTKKAFKKYGPAQKDGTSFVLPKEEADALLAKGDKRGLEEALGLPKGYLEHDDLVRVDIPNPKSDGLNLRLPSGNEAGANNQWRPGGVLPNGNTEAVIDLGSAPPGAFSATPIDHL